MSNPFSSKNQVTASAQELENFIRGYLESNYDGTSVGKATEQHEQYTDTQLSFWYIFFDIKLVPIDKVRWGCINLREFDNRTLYFLLSLDTDGIMALCDSDLAMFHRELQKYQQTLNDLEAKILEHFKQANEQPKSEKVTAPFRKQAMMWRDLRVLIKQRVRPSTSACIAELQNKPPYKNENLTRQYVEMVLKRGAAGDYNSFLESL